MAIRILFIGEIVGKPGVFSIKSILPGLRKEKNIDFVIANGDGVTGGFGIGKNHSIYLHKLGVDVITSGDCIYYKKDMVPHIEKAPYILRAANYPPGNPGRGWRIYKVKDTGVAVISMLGQSGFNRVHLSNPFTYLPDLVSRIKQETPNIVMDFHATTTAEKQTMFHFADGLVSAIIGTHSRVLSAGATILPKGTAVLTDAGRTGSIDSVGGLNPEIEIRKFLTQIPERSRESWKRLELQGAIIDIENGKAVFMETLRIPCEAPPDSEKQEEDDPQNEGE